MFPLGLLLVEKVRIDHDDSEPGTCRAAVQGTEQADADSKREVAKLAALAQEGAEQKGRRDDGFPGRHCAVMGRSNRPAATCAGSASGKCLRRGRRKLNNSTLWRWLYIAEKGEASVTASLRPNEELFFPDARLCVHCLLASQGNLENDGHSVFFGQHIAMLQ